MLMTLRTLAGLRSMFATLPYHFRFSFPTLWPFLLFPSTAHQDQTATHACTAPFNTSGDLSTYVPPSTHPRLTPTFHAKRNSQRDKISRRVSRRAAGLVNSSRPTWQAPSFARESAGTSSTRCKPTHLVSQLCGGAAGLAAGGHHWLVVTCLRQLFTALV